MTRIKVNDISNAYSTSIDNPIMAVKGSNVSEIYVKMRPNDVIEVVTQEAYSILLWDFFRWAFP